MLCESEQKKSRVVGMKIAEFSLANMSVQSNLVVQIVKIGLSEVKFVVTVHETG